MKKSKLLSYSALTATLGAISAQDANAEIIYNDITDVTINRNDSYDLDLDGGGDIDFTFYNTSTSYSSTYTSSYMSMNIPQGNGVAVETREVKELNPFRSILTENIADLATEIDIKPLSFYDEEYGIFRSSFGSGVWGNTDAYVAVKFMVGQNTHYGWIRVETTSNQVIIKEYAYESTPEATLKTGEIPESAVGISLIDVSNGVSVYPNPATDEVNLELDGAFDVAAELRVLDMHGNVVSTQSVGNFDNVEIPLTDLSKGIYTIEIIAKEKVAVKKIVKN